MASMTSEDGDALTLLTPRPLGRGPAMGKYLNEVGFSAQ